MDELGESSEGRQPRIAIRIEELELDEDGFGPINTSNRFDSSFFQNGIQAKRNLIKPNRTPKVTDTIIDDSNTIIVILDDVSLLIREYNSCKYRYEAICD